MKKASLLFTALLVSLCCLLQAQSHDYVYRNPQDSSFNAYLKVYPQAGPIKGLIVRDYSRLPDMRKASPYRFLDLCRKAGYLTLYTNTSPHFPEFFTDDRTLALLDTMIHEVIAEHDIPRDKIYMGGISASGARALKYAQYCASGKSDLRLAGVFAVDAPLDLERFYHSATAHQQYFKAGMLVEAQMMVDYFDRFFSGDHGTKTTAFRGASVFSHADSLGGNASLLGHTPILIFHEPDIDWWMEERGCSYVDINSYDLVAFAVCLKSLGHQDLEIIATSGMGFDRQGNRNPHSWTIVDEDYLLAWLERLSSRK